MESPPARGDHALVSLYWERPGGLMMKLDKPAISALSAAVLLGLAGNSGAATNEELEARIAELETKIAILIAMQNESPRLEQLPRPETKWPTPQDTDGSTSAYSFGGYIKIDSMFTDYGSGDVAPSNPIRQFYIPGLIPVNGEPTEGPDYRMQAQETRFSLKSDHALANGKSAQTYIEFDFFLSDLGNERVSNSFQPRMRHAYFKYDKWLFGQTWTTFQDVAALPENLDFIGPAESTAFGRQPMIRYTSGPIEVAIENSQTTLTPNGGGARIVSDDDAIPDLTARYTMSLDGGGYVKVAGLLRSLYYDIDGQSDSSAGYGVSVSGKHFFGRDDVRWMATTGKGMGRYFGVNTSNGGVLDADGNIEAISQWGAFASYRHFWKGSLRSNLTLGYTSIDNPVDLTGTGVTKDVYSLHLNLLYSPVPRMTIGGEYIYARRQLESGADGDISRLLLSAKYAF